MATDDCSSVLTITDSTKIVIGNRFTNGDKGKKNGNLPSLHCFCSSFRARWKYGGGCSRVTDSGKLEWRGMKFTFYLIVLLVIWSISNFSISVRSSLRFSCPKHPKLAWSFILVLVYSDSVCFLVVCYFLRLYLWVVNVKCWIQFRRANL